MIGLVAGTVLSCALSASAFLLPPNIAAVASDSKSLVAPPLDDATLYGQAVLLPCSSCAFPYKDYKTDSDDDFFHAQGSANLLAFNFTITSDKPSELQLNGHTIYPFDIFTELENLESDWSINQLPASTTDEQLLSGDYTKSPLRITGAGVGVGPVKTFAQDNEDLVSLRWQLLSLEEHMMTVDSLYIQMIRQADGKLMLLSIDSAPAHVLDEVAFPMPDAAAPDVSTKPEHHHQPSGCGFLPQAICDTLHRLGGKIHGMGKPRPGCHKGMKGGKNVPPPPPPPHGRPPFGPHDGKPEDMPERPHHGRPHGHHDHHDHHDHPRHGVFHLISRAILSFLIPVMAGITVGMTVSILGLLFGRFIGWLCFTVIPARRRGYTAVVVEERPSSMSKEVVYVEEVEALPLYEDAPAYEEIAKEDK